MDPIKYLTEHHIHIQNEQQQNKSINPAQGAILLRAHLMNALCFGAWSLTPEEEKKQKQLTAQYLKSLKPWNHVPIWLHYTVTGDAGGADDWIVISNDWDKIKIQAHFMNKKIKQWIRSFSTKNWYSLCPTETSPHRDKSDGTGRFFIIIPDSHTVPPTMGMPQETRDRIHELYRQAGDPQTCYHLVNSLKWWDIWEK